MDMDMDTNEKVTKTEKEQPYAWKDFRKKVDTLDKLEKYFDGREYLHTNFYHYTKYNTLKNILAKKTFWLCNVRGFNDKEDSRQFGEDEACYSICFSAGIHENLPLWYLYAGVDGKGGRIGLTKKKFGDLIDNINKPDEKTGKLKIELKLCEIDSKGNAIDTGVKLIEGVTMDVKTHDIIYGAENDSRNTKKKNEDNGKVELRYSTMINRKLMSELDDVKERFRRYYKNLIWFYEKETRIVVTLKGEAKDKVKEDLKKTENFKYVVTMKINDKNITNNWKVTLAPAIEKTDGCEEYNKIKQYITYSKNLTYSDYQGQLNMDLCRSCKGKICRDCKTDPCVFTQKSKPKK